MRRISATDDGFSKGNRRRCTELRRRAWMKLITRGINRRQRRRDDPAGHTGQVDRLTDRHPVHNVYDNVVGVIAVAERDRAVIVRFKPEHHKGHRRSAGPRDVRLRKRNCWMLVEILIELSGGRSVKCIAGRVGHQQRRRDRTIRHPG